MSGIVSKLALGAITFLSGYTAHSVVESPPQSLPTASPAGINLTAIAGYAILGGLVFYFGKKIIK